MVHDTSNNYLGSVYFNNPGELNDYPFVKLYWDRWPYWWNGVEDPKHYAETIRISRLTPGWQYLLVVDDGTVGGSSSNWGPSGIKAYVYKEKTLLKTYTPPAGTGSYWYIGKIVGGGRN